MTDQEKQIQDELTRRIIDLDSRRQTRQFQVHDEDLIDALEEMTDVPREEIETIAHEVRSAHGDRLAGQKNTSRYWQALPLKTTGGIVVALIAMMGVYQMYSHRSTQSQSPILISQEKALEPQVEPQSDAAADELSSEFQRLCPRPRWWHRVSIKGVNIQTYDDLLQYWQDKHRSKNQFFKAAYQAILDHPRDTSIVVTAIKLMPYGDSGYPHIVALLAYAVNRYFSYNDSLANYGGMPGDSIAGIVEKLAGMYTRQGQPERALALIERLLAERGNEVNDHLLELIALEHATALWRLDRRPEAVAVLKHAIATYMGSWEKRLKAQLARYEQQS